MFEGPLDIGVRPQKSTLTAFMVSVWPGLHSSRGASSSARGRVGSGAEWGVGPVRVGEVAPCETPCETVTGGRGVFAIESGSVVDATGFWSSVCITKVGSVRKFTTETRRHGGTEDSTCARTHVIGADHSIGQDEQDPQDGFRI